MNTIETAIQLLALSKIADKDARKLVAPGKHAGTFTATIDFDLRVGEDFEQVVAQSVPWQRIAAIALAKLNNVTVEAIVREAVGKDAEELNTDDIEARAKKAVAELLGSKARKVAGKVTGTVTVVDIQADGAAKEVAA